MLSSPLTFRRLQDIFVRSPYVLAFPCGELSSSTASRCHQLNSLSAGNRPSLNLINSHFGIVSCQPSGSRTPADAGGLKSAGPGSAAALLVSKHAAGNPLQTPPTPRAHLSQRGRQTNYACSLRLRREERGMLPPPPRHNPPPKLNPYLASSGGGGLFHS